MRTFDRFIGQKAGGKTMLNLGCGKTFHPDWVNVDFVSSDANVISYDLTKGIPFSSETFDVVYHSHVLEHFTASQGDAFIKECFRLLKPGGILRIAVPDLERIARNYIQFLEQALLQFEGAADKYEWTKLELFDQMTRHVPGGMYKDFLLQASEDQKKFARERLGKELDAIQDTQEVTFFERLKRKSAKELMRLSKVRIVKAFLKLLGGNRMSNAFELGLFRMSGEVHQCMYDRYSLSALLRSNQFADVKVMSAYQSDIPSFEAFNLDVFQGEVRKPDSLFIEARKK
jgi:predicted SAM-dependent methyltransferase